MKFFDIPIINRLVNYSWGAFVNRLLIFLLLPLVSKALIPEDFAVYSLLLLFAALATHIFQLGLHQSLMTLYHRQPDNECKKTLIATTWKVVAINSVILLFLIIFFKEQIAAVLINSRADFGNLVALTGIMIFFDVFCGLTLALLNIRQESKSYSILNLTKNLIMIVGVICLMLSGGMNIEQFFIILTFASIAAFVHSLYFMRRIWKELSQGVDGYCTFSGSILKSMLRFGIFMVPATFAVISLQSADRYMLNLLSPGTLFDVGIYAAAYKIGMIMSLFTVVFDLVFFPYILQITDHNKAKRDLRNLYNLYLYLAGLIAAVIILFSREIFLIVDNSYQAGAGLVFFGVISMFLRGLSNVLVLGFYIQKRSEKIAAASVIAAVINIILNWLWIPHYGIIGAGFASIIAYLFIVTVNFITVENSFRAGFNPVPLFCSLLTLLGISWVNYHLYTIDLQTFLLKLFIMVFLIFSMVLLAKQKRYLQFIIKRINNED